MHYLNYGKYSVEYNECLHVFSFYYEGKGIILKNGQVMISKAYLDNAFSCYKAVLAGFGKVVFEHKKLPDAEKLTVKYFEGTDLLKVLVIEFQADICGISAAVSWAVNEDESDNINDAHVNINNDDARINIDVKINGSLLWGKEPEKSTYAVCLSGEGNALRAAHGPAASKNDKALYDRLTDALLEVTGVRTVRIKYDWENSCYNVSAIMPDNSGRLLSFGIRILEDYYTNKYKVPHRPINRKNKFPNPPAGWMTWNAVKFNASENTVMRNAEWMAANLKEYGARYIWIDWEWYHSNILGTEKEGVDIFHPNRERYPEGLKHMADRIRNLGLIPALWIAPTNDTNKNAMLNENPEWILAHEPTWVGQWWIDPTHPGVLAEFVPAVLRQLLDWGYEAIKLDSLPISLEIYDKYHDRFHDRSVSSEKALRNIIEACRRTSGNNRYMLSCSGGSSRSILFAADYFDGARIGEDIFSWNRFIKNGVDKLFAYYLYHNILWYADMDNIIVRSEYCNMNQARSRVSMYALTGLPINYGDNLPDLENERVELLRRVTPAADIHPMDLYEKNRDKPYIIINLNVEKKFGSWNIAGVFNLSDKDIEVSIDLNQDLNLDASNGEKYILYEYWSQRRIDICGDKTSIRLSPFAVNVISINKISENPQIISTSRHIAQGVHDLLDITWLKEDMALKGRSYVVSNETYRLVVYVPDNYKLCDIRMDKVCSINISRHAGNIVEIEFDSDEGGEREWMMHFTCCPVIGF
ncbi:MAG: alpha-galactosidase [Eubacteriales bacterium]|nr:alpha-galactosidase [Eubacteriales bacterium]